MDTDATPGAMRLEIHESANPPGAAEISAGLFGHFTERAGHWPRQPLTLILRDAEGVVRGGIRAETGVGWLEVDHFWLDDSLRGRGEGSRLLARAEEIARQRGAIGAHLTTSTFQAVGFYLKQGYVEIGRLKDRPVGHDKVWMSKRWG
jgi:GNAT superfamily N-acetyltransferase